MGQSSLSALLAKLKHAWLAQSTLNMEAIETFEFRGLIGGRALFSITTNEFMHALRDIGWREAHNAHILQKLRERGRLWGINTPEDFARALRNGYTILAHEGAKARVCCNGMCWVIFREAERTLITIRHPGNEQD